MQRRRPGRTTGALGDYSALQLLLRGNLEIKLLTTSKDVSLRRLRGFAAPVGAKADIVSSIEELLTKLKNGDGKQIANIVLHDTSIPVSDDQLRQLNKMARVYRIGPVGSVGSANAVSGTHTEFQIECGLAEFFDSIIVRRSLPHVWGWPPTLHAENLLGWGHAITKWHANQGQDLAEVAQKFHQSIALTGNGRRLIELLSHQASSRLPVLDLEVGEATFGCDGSLVLMSLKCQYNGDNKPDLAALALELRTYQMPMAGLIYHGANCVEIMGVAPGNPNLPIAALGTLLLLNRDQEYAQKAPSALPRAV